MSVISCIYPATCSLKELSFIQFSLVVLVRHSLGRVRAAFCRHSVTRPLWLIPDAPMGAYE